MVEVNNYSPARSPPMTLPKLLILEIASDRPGHLLGIPLPNELPCNTVNYGIYNSSGPLGDHWDSHCCSFEKPDRKSLAPARTHEDSHDRKEFSDV